MRIYARSRRQDLLVGCLASTLIICLGVWLSEGPPLNAEPQAPRTGPPTRLTPFPPVMQETPPVPQDEQPVKRNSPADATPQQPDYPSPPRPDTIAQAVEPQLPNIPAVDTSRIPGNWGPGDGPGAEIFDPNKLDQQPVPIVQGRPQYPSVLRSDGITGEVVIDFIVDTRGNVRNAKAIRSSDGRFESAAESAVGKWRFQPGRKGGHAVFTHMQVAIEFTLDGQGQ